MFKRNLIAFLIMTATLCLSHAQQTVSGILIDGKTKQPVEFAAISTKINSAVGTMSDDKGKFNIKVQQGRDSLYVMHMQYEMKAVAIKDIKKEIYLTPLKTNLDTVNVYGLGPKGILIKAFDNVKKNYHLSDFFVDIDLYETTKENQTLTSLGYLRALWKPFSVLGIKIFMPVNFIRTVGQTDSITDNLTFGIMDVVWHYNVEIFYAKYLKTQLQNSSAKFTMQIVEDNGRETGYIICKEDSAQGEQSYTGKYVKVQSALNVPRIVKYYIDASDFSIQRIETGLSENRQHIVKSGENEIAVDSWVSTIQFSEYNDKLYLSNCFSRVKYHYTDDVDGIFEEKVMFDARACRELGEDYDIPKKGFAVRSLDELKDIPTFKSFAEME